MIKATIICATMSGPAFAGLAECAMDEGHHRAMAHRDLGGGIVSYEQSFMALPNSGQDQHVVENCASGTRVITVMKDWVRKAPDARKAVKRTFESMVSSKASFGLVDVQRKLSATGAQSSMQKLNKESCACAAAYPNLRGEKQKFKS